MNCLLLLIILFCCNGNGNCGGGGCNRSGCDLGNCRRQNSCGETCNMRREENRERTVGRRECECDATPRVHTHTPPPMQRTQFPYLDVEPRTCGCEEKSES